jgi:hypothetical protein
VLLFLPNCQKCRPFSYFLLSFWGWYSWKFGQQEEVCWQDLQDLLLHMPWLVTRLWCASCGKRELITTAVQCFRATGAGWTCAFSPPPATVLYVPAPASRVQGRGPLTVAVMWRPPWGVDGVLSLAALVSSTAFVTSVNFRVFLRKGVDTCRRKYWRRMELIGCSD